jgi:PKD domain-containing protein
MHLVIEKEIAPRRRRTGRALVGISALAALLLAAGSALAARSIALYRGEPSGAGGLQLAGWGSGEAVDTSAEAFSGSNSIKLTTDGYYAGGRLIFRTPIDITEQFKDPFTFLEMAIKFLPGRIRTGPGGTVGSDYSGPGGAPGYGGPGGGPGGAPGYGGPGGAGGVGDPNDPSAALLITPDTQRLRVVLQFEGGVAVAEDHPLIRFVTSEPMWVRVAIPFSSFKGAPQMASYRLQEMRIFGDAPDTFFVGQINTVTDSDPISVEPLEEQVVAVNDRVEFVGSADGGIAGLKYSWDFDKSDGIQEDAIGARVFHTFTKASPDNKPYIVTLTVSDISGAKRPVSIETTVEVID